jgi:hypothetical protein
MLPIVARNVVVDVRSCAGLTTGDQQITQILVTKIVIQLVGYQYLCLDAAKRSPHEVHCLIERICSTKATVSIAPPELSNFTAFESLHLTFTLVWHVFRYCTLLSPLCHARSCYCFEERNRAMIDLRGICDNHGIDRRGAKIAPSKEQARMAWMSETNNDDGGRSFLVYRALLRNTD